MQLVKILISRRFAEESSRREEQHNLEPGDVIRGALSLALAETPSTQLILVADGLAQDDLVGWLVDIPLHTVARLQEIHTQIQKMRWRLHRERGQLVDLDFEQLSFDRFLGALIEAQQRRLDEDMERGSSLVLIKPAPEQPPSPS